MGLIITELKARKPELPYFDESFTGEYPQEAPFTVSELEEIYPTASGKSKEDPAYKEAALEATLRLQSGDRGYRALWKHIIAVSVADLKKNYSNLDVEFDLWKGESDADPLIPGLVSRLKESGLAYESQGALVVDVKEDTDTKEMPPCIILKSDGAALYATTDLATIVDRMENLHADSLIYLADKRQEMHFVQVFRVAKKAGLVTPETELKYVGFGTMNGKDGKPFKTREGGVMRLEYLIRDIDEVRYPKAVMICLRKRQERSPKSSVFPQSNTEICPIRLLRTIFSILIASLPSRETRVRIFCIQSCVLNRSLPSIRSRERAWKTCAWRRHRALPKKI